jgi:hypothetical protein
MKNIEQFSDNHLFEDLLLDESPLSINQHDSVSLRSIAISMKRIADSMDMTDEHMCIPKSLGIIAHVLAGDKI